VGIVTTAGLMADPQARKGARTHDDHRCRLSLPDSVGAKRDSIGCEAVRRGPQRGGVDPDLRPPRHPYPANSVNQGGLPRKRQWCLPGAA